MKITFIYTDYGKYNTNNFNLGVAILSSCLKQEGFTTSLIHVSGLSGKMTKGRLVSLVKQHDPDIIALSFVSNMFPQIKLFSSWLKDLNIPLLHGGLHPTIAPLECLAQEGINNICLGEGEGAIVDFCKAIKSGGNIKNIPNIWVKEKGIIHKNLCRDLIEDLDILPYPDYELFQYQNLEESRIYKMLITQASRGCAYSCSYCCNQFLRALYKNRDKYFRYHSVDRILDEIAQALGKYPDLKEIRFCDDTLSGDKDWFSEFAVKYKKKIGLPYSGNERVENIDPKTVLMLKESGCVSLDLGVESGNEGIRKNVMNRHVPNLRIIEAFNLLKYQGIKANAFNILGIIGENKDTVIDTIKLNALIGPDIFFNAYFYPFKGTSLYEKCQNMRLTVKDDISSFFEVPAVDIYTISRRELVFFYKYFILLVKIYKALINRFGERSRAVMVLDKILKNKYFPYTFLNIIYIDTQRIRILFKKYPKLYNLFRKYKNT